MELRQTGEQEPVPVRVEKPQIMPEEEMNLMERSILIVHPQRRLTVIDVTAKRRSPNHCPKSA